MANGTGASGIQATANAALGTTGGLVIAEWLVQPSWPPPVPVLTIAVGLLTPILHLVFRTLYRRIERWSEADGLPVPQQPPVTHAAPPAPTKPAAAGPAPVPQA